jgi:hypothetical protein
MKISAARTVGQNLASMLHKGEIAKAYTLLEPILSERTPFPALNQIGCAVGECPLELANALLERIAQEKTMGGWVVIGSALGAQLDREFEAAFSRCRDYIVAADVWYAADILGERLPGPALVDNFDRAVTNLIPWREDPNRWVRRSVGVSVHYWAKKSRGAEILAPCAGELLAFLSPMFSEWELEATKGVAWGLKTLGKYYPQLVSPWLAEKISDPQISYRAVMLRKATTYLPESQKVRILGEIA